MPTSPLGIYVEPRHADFVALVEEILTVTEIEETRDINGRSLDVTIKGFFGPAAQTIAATRVKTLTAVQRARRQDPSEIHAATITLAEQIFIRDAEISALRATLAQYETLYPPLP